MESAKLLNAFLHRLEMKFSNNINIISNTSVFIIKYVDK